MTTRNCASYLMGTEECRYLVVSQGSLTYPASTHIHILVKLPSSFQAQFRSQEKSQIQDLYSHLNLVCSTIWLCLVVTCSHS